MIKVFNVNFLTFGKSLSSTRKPRGRRRRTALILYIPLRKPYLHFTPFKTFAMSAHLTLPLLQTRIIQGKLVLSQSKSLVEVKKAMSVLRPSFQRSRNLSIVNLLPSISLGIPDNSLLLIYTPGWRQAPRE